MKLKLEYSFFLILFFQDSLFADDFNKYCNPPKDRPSEIACDYAIVHQTPFLETATAMFFAMMENTSNYCAVPLPAKYIRGVELATAKSPRLKTIKKAFMKQFEKQDPPGSVGRKKEFCNTYVRR